MGSCLSCRNCICAFITAWPETADHKQKQLEKMVIVVVHPAEERVLEMGDGAPLTVAELMLEFPGHFVAEYVTMDISTKRATPLPADHEASPGGIYILLPTHRLHSRVSPHESSSYKALLTSYIHRNLHPAAQTRSQKKSLHSLMMQASSAKVTPLSASNLQEEQEKVPPHLAAVHHPTDGDVNCQSDDEIDQLLQYFCSARPEEESSLSRHASLFRSKSWIPRLQTIDESSILVA